MEITLDKQYPVAASTQTAWVILSNIPELTSCMPGAQITDQIDRNHFKGAVKVKVGPAVAAFAGDIEILAVDAVMGTLRLMGKGADKGGSSASMDLTATLAAAPGGGSLLHGKATVIVNGKFAQFAGRMMISVADTILAQFAKTFAQKVQALNDTAKAAALTEAAQAHPNPTDAPAAGAKPTRPINGPALLWAILRNWFSGLFGRNA